MTRIGFDARMRGRTGIGTYIADLLEVLPAALGPETTLVLFGATGEQPVTLTASGRVEMVPVSGRIYGPQEQTRLRWQYRRARLDLLHAPHYNQPLRTRQRMVLTINDLIPLIFPEMQRPLPRAYNRMLLLNAVRQAAHLIVPSLHTSQDLQQRLSVPASRITVIPDGVHPRYHPRRDPQAEVGWLARLQLRPPFLLYLGQWKPYKNLVQLIEAFARLDSRSGDLTLVIGGKEDPRFPEVRARAASLGDRVRFTGWLPQEALPHLYRSAAAFTVPSLYEGFGLPVLEAMACGAPVVCSRLTSLPEVAAEAAEYWDVPTGTAGLAEAISTALRPDRAAELRERGLRQAAKFTWQQTAQSTAAVYRRILGQ